MKILIRTLSKGVGHQILDAWHAYKQHQSHYDNGIEYTLINTDVDFDPTDYNLTILFDSVNEIQLNEQLVKKYDIVLICNGGEPIMVASPIVKTMLNYSNVFLVANSYLTPDHELKHKVICFPYCVQLCRDFWTRHFYPQYFDLYDLKKIKKTNSLYYINGANRTPRQLFIDHLNLLNLDITIKNSLTEQISEIGESQWESSEDTEFRTWVNQHYNEKVLIEEYNNPYYDMSVSLGIDQKFGTIPPGFFHLPLYFENYCVIFPETTWQNNELCMTEKAIKCFYSECLPLPVGGSKVNQLYNKIGFYTAWNLLPPELQKFDNTVDHKLRYLQLSHAVKWLSENPSVFVSDQYKEMVQQNKINFLTCECDHLTVADFDNIITGFIR
jgi:hypothetical protein